MMMVFFSSAVVVCLFGTTAAAAVVVVVVTRLRRARAVGFFHPYCASGGGGERVLWVGVAALKKRYPKLKVIIYTGDRMPLEELRSRVRERFGVEVPEVELCVVRLRFLLDPGNYPVATLLGQSIGSAVLGVECCLRRPTRLWVDTTGFAFTYVIARIFGHGVAAYVHYPTVSSDMVASLDAGVVAFNNRYVRLKHLKKLYYGLFAALYRLNGRLADAVAANSTWTEKHVVALWNVPVVVAYPPCGGGESGGETFFRDDDDDDSDDDEENIVCSLAQFRPEKNHALQLEAWALVPENVKRRATLVVAGATRHAGDEALLRDLKAKADGSVRFLVNGTRDDVVALLRKAKIGLHTMRFEHFGIAVVEMMAANTVPVAHASAGPLLDIVGTKRDRGFVCDTAREYADAINLLLTDDNRRRQMAATARAFVVDRFSDAAFATAFVDRFLKQTLLDNRLLLFDDDGE